MAALGLAFVSTAALWWLYFSYVARIAERRLELSDDQTTTARDAFTYLHVVFVAGIIVSAVGDELVIAHPTEELRTPELVAAVAGPVIYLLAHVLFRLRLAGSLSWRRLGAAAACVVIGLAGTELPALAVAALLAAVLVALIAWEDQAARSRRGRGEASPLEQLEASNPG
jgi:low temperature requirement protein LtrA